MTWPWERGVEWKEKEDEFTRCSTNLLYVIQEGGSKGTFTHSKIIRTSSTRPRYQNNL